MIPSLSLRTKDKLVGRADALFMYFMNYFGVIKNQSLIAQLFDKYAWIKHREIS